MKRGERREGCKGSQEQEKQEIERRRKRRRGWWNSDKEVEEEREKRMNSIYMYTFNVHVHAVYTNLPFTNIQQESRYCIAKSLTIQDNYRIKVQCTKTIVNLHYNTTCMYMYMTCTCTCIWQVHVHVYMYVWNIILCIQDN